HDLAEMQQLLLLLDRDCLAARRIGEPVQEGEGRQCRGDQDAEGLESHRSGAMLHLIRRSLVEGHRPRWGPAYHLRGVDDVRAVGHGDREPIHAARRRAATLLAEDAVLRAMAEALEPRAA